MLRLERLCTFSYYFWLNNFWDICIYTIVAIQEDYSLYLKYL